MKALLLASAVLAAVGCATEPAALRVPEHKSSSEGDAAAASAPSDEPTTVTPSITSPTTTTTGPEPVTTTAYVAPVTTRRTTTTARPTQLAPVVHDGDFWYRLATCESRNGALSPNQFQFMGGTAEKVGYYDGASYEAQRAMAIDWAARIHPNEGTSAGWPVCWWTARAGA